MKECGANFGIDYHNEIHIHSDNDMVIKLSEKNARLQCQIENLGNKYSHVYASVCKMDKTTTQKKVLEVMDNIYY